uniref:PH domain-containing protein n=1 Tax=Periophthalmus magnuspinnatus TaxID=409849 RepID=A0A3B3ZDF3_9GOBI
AEEEHLPRRGVALAGPAPDKVGWVRQYCGRGLFRELWKNRYLVLRRERLWVCSKEVKEECRAQLVLDLSKYERCEELKKDKSRSKKSHSRFTLTRRVHSLVFLAVSPEEKESWIQVLNSAINRAKTRPKDPTLDQVALEDGALVHLTKDRVRVPLGRRLPSRGHLLAVASSSHGSLTLDLVSEEDFCSRGSWERDMHGAAGMQRAGTDVSKLRPRETRVKTGSLPRTSERNWGRGEASKALKNRSNIQVRLCSGLSELRCPSEERPVGQLQSLIAQRMQRAQELLEEMRLQVRLCLGLDQDQDQSQDSDLDQDRNPDVQDQRAEAERLLQEALCSWKQAQEVLKEVKDLQSQTLRRQRRDKELGKEAQQGGRRQCHNPIKSSV